ncbi:MAG: segregation/condensation protein A [Candidatus Paceibacterota bacterium]
MKKEDFTVQTSIFEGPLSLLLELVQKRKIFISDIALADIAEEFIVLIQKEDNKGLSKEASFIQIASTLLLLKSKSLLPHFDITDDEEESALGLARRLEMFEKIRSYASLVDALYGQQIHFEGHKEKNEELNASIFSPEERFSKELFLERVMRVRDNLPTRNEPPRIAIKQTVRLEDVLDNLSKRIKKYVALSFREFAQVGETSRGDVVVHFIALLELIKQGFLEARQSEASGDIELRHKEIAVPNYS